MKKTFLVMFLAILGFMVLSACDKKSKDNEESAMAQPMGMDNMTTESMNSTMKHSEGAGEPASDATTMEDATQTQ